MARKAIQDGVPSTLLTAARIAVNALRPYFIRTAPQRVIPIPKVGGFLPLIPIFAGLSALGALAGGAAGVAKAVNDAKAAERKLEEEKRDNQLMEAISLKKGSGLYIPFSAISKDVALSWQKTSVEATGPSIDQL